MESVFTNKYKKGKQLLKEYVQNGIYTNEASSSPDLPYSVMPDYDATLLMSDISEPVSRLVKEEREKQDSSSFLSQYTS